MSEKKRYSDEELEEFKELILKKLAKAQEDYEILRASLTIKHLQAALIRIENKTYGICRETGELIPKERLRAVPHATLSIAGKEQQNKRR